ncbi:MAG TPA: anti-sigma factor [Pyrinomonadaceae bacterium]|jgi:anti-sigma-K factor RskA|nr:anti-sigma factor [Pyrinomonadaceae bacterium]
MGHEDYKEMLALEAVGALEAEGRRALDAHLPGCAECRAEMRDMSDAAAGLAYSVAPVAPPAHLRARILETVRAQATAAAEGATPPASSDIRGEARRLLARLGLWEILRARPALGFGAGVAFAAIAALAFTTALLWQRADRLGAEVAQLSGRLNDTQGELAEQRGQLARQRELAEMLAAPGTRVASLNGKDVAPQAHAVVAVHSATGRAMLVAEGLPAAPAGKAYQLWFIAGGKPPMPGGVFKTDASGRAMMKDLMPEGAASANTFAVTLEAEAGEQAPKGAMFLLSAAS